MTANTLGWLLDLAIALPLVLVGGAIVANEIAFWLHYRKEG